MSELHSYEAPVIFEKKALASKNTFLGCIHLNAPKSFNSLTLIMVQEIQKQLNEWRDDKSIAALFLDGEGEKAFCAGGDVKGLFNGRVDSAGKIDNPSAINFFDQEYTLDYCLHAYPKPIICWANGVVMGGGLGLMAACVHRVVTETTRSAMPEITIGLFPDVGGSWFLNRCPGKTGLFLGLTGVSINAHDAIYSRLANRFIADTYKSEVFSALLKLSDADIQNGKITECLKGFEQNSLHKLPTSELKQHASFIESVCDYEKLSDMVAAIVNQASTHQSTWLQSAAKTLAQGCPITAHLVFEQLQRGKYLSLREVFVMERKISAQCMRHGDFYEGVRALLIDKDKNPQWTHKNVAEVGEEFLKPYFYSELP